MIRLVIGLIIILLFTISIIVGFNTSQQLGLAVREILREQFSPLTSYFNASDPASLFLLSLIIFTNNMRVALLNIVLGVSLVGPAGIMVVNGFIIGLVLSIQEDVVSGVLVIIPHGVLEIPALIYSAVLGTHLGLTILTNIRRNPAKVREVFRDVIRKIPIIVLMLILAALIEVFVSLLIVAPFVSSS
ncbi:MAG: stage II sporulation protein M [Desulfurococcaceae archaeon TW002]